MAHLLGLDIGTTGCKAALFDETGKSLGAATAEYPLIHPRPGWAEQDPETWWISTVEAIRSLLRQTGTDASEIAGIGLSGQMHGAVLLDENIQPVRHAIIWSDQRTTAQCREITNRIGAERLIRLTGNPALEGFTAPKVLWVRENEPEVFARARLLLLPKDYIRYRLTGEIATDVSDAAGTLLFDVQHARWSGEVLDALRLDESFLPPVRASADQCGAIMQEVAAKTGLAEGTPVVAGGADNACGAVGTGAVSDGLGLLSIGTSGVLLAFSAEPRIEPGGRIHTFNHAVPRAFYLMGVTQGAGFSLRWLRDVLRVQDDRDMEAYSIMTAEAAQVPPLSSGLIFLPYLQGERTPHMDALARGVFFGLSGAHTRAHLIRAVMEGVAYSLRDSWEILRGLGVELDAIRVAGGGARSELWLHILADGLGTELARTTAAEGPAFGAALLAAVGVGVYRDLPAACGATIAVAGRVEPDPDTSRRYDQGYQVYRTLYPTLQKTFVDASALVQP
ncbi:MAG TPA: xylulokinase [Chloroflexota bacterium]